MPFDWAEYLRLAYYLQGQAGVGCDQEAGFRTATSRAYYAAFCHARNHARDRLGFTPVYDSRDHGLVRKHFRGSRMADIAMKLDSLRQWRNDCDYDDTVPGAAAMVVAAIKEAQLIVGRLV